DGGSVILTAKALDSLARAVVNNTGLIEARTVESVNGVVRLGGGEVYVAGTIDVQGGGSVKVLGERVALLDGARIDAGGPQGGDGGFVETSSRRYLEATRAPDLAAPAGKGGTWLLDPETVNIESATDSNITLVSPFQPVAATGASTLNVSTLNSALNSG